MEKNGKETVYKISVEAHHTGTVADLFCLASKLSKTKIKHAMTKGAAWITVKGKTTRIRRATAHPIPGSLLALYYNQDILDRNAQPGLLVKDETRYSVWFKPAGLMSQGTRYGDHAAILRQVEVHFNGKRPVFLINRLDREAEGLMIIAHTRKEASALSLLFQQRKVTKQYRAWVKNTPGSLGERAKIAFPLDGKSAITWYTPIHHDGEKNASLVDIWIDTGRLHQIRRHFDMIGCPIMGDPKYGQHNKNKDGLKLAAVHLAFTCPVTGREQSYRVSPSWEQKSR